MGMNLLMNSMYSNNAGRNQNKQNNPFGIDRGASLSRHFNGSGTMQSNPYPMRQPTQQQRYQGQQQQYQRQQSTQQQQPQNQMPSSQTKEHYHQEHYQQEQFKQEQFKQEQFKQDNIGEINREGPEKKETSDVCHSNQDNISNMKLSEKELRRAMLINEVLSVPVSKKRRRQGQFGRR